jgi:hypothetical protein
MVVKDPEELKNLCDEGYRIYSYRKGGRVYYEARKGNDKKCISKDLSELAEELMRRQRERPVQPTSGSTSVHSSDANVIAKVVETRIDERKPLKKRQIESLAWYNNLILDIGRYALHMLESEGLAKLDPEDYDDYEKAREKFIAALDDLKKVKDYIPKFKDIEFERNHYRLKYDALLAVARRMRTMLAQQHQLLQMCMAVMDEDSLRKLIAALIILDISRLLPPEMDKILKLE